MEAFKHLLPILIKLSLAAIVIAIGMRATRDELLYAFRRPVVLLKALLAVDVIPPLAAGTLIWFLPLDPVVKAAIMLMAIAPVPPLVPGKALKLGARNEYTIGVYVALALLTIVVVPIICGITFALFGLHDRIPFEAIAKTVLISVVIPLAIGIGIHRWRPVFAERAAPWIAKLGPILLVIAFAPILAVAMPEIVRLIGNGTLAAMAIVTVIATVAGHVLGGPLHADRKALAVTAALRHPGIAIAVAMATFHDPHVISAVLLFLLVGVAVSAVYTAMMKHAGRTPVATAV